MQSPTLESRLELMGSIVVAIRRFATAISFFSKCDPKIVVGNVVPINCSVAPDESAHIIALDTHWIDKHSHTEPAEIDGFPNNAAGEAIKHATKPIDQQSQHLHQ